MTPEPAPSATTTPDELELDLGWALGIVSRAYRQVGASAVERLPGGPRGLHLLSAISGSAPRTQLALAQRLGVDKTVMTYLLDELEAAKLVRRQPDPTDRRARQVLITAKGTQALARARGKIAASEALLLRTLQPDEAQTLRELLRRVAQTTQHTEAGDSIPPPC